MRELIASLPHQIREAIQIGESTAFKGVQKELTAVLVCGLGGSGIGGKIVSLLLKDELKVPFLCINDYEVPAWVNAHTLVIASSYSGNTEETLYAVKECAGRGAEVAVITSGGELLELAKSNGWNHFVVPGGEQPRAMLAYSIVQQLYLLNRYGLIAQPVLVQLQAVAEHIEQEKTAIEKQAQEMAAKFVGKRAIIYAGTDFEGVAVRWRQQINENAKELCWHHVLPEMTHNELVGWAGGSPACVAVFLKTDYDHPRTNYRWTISKEVISAKTPDVYTLDAKGATKIAQVFYLIHLGDWISLYMSEIKAIDAVEVKVISHLKSEMAKLK